MQLPNDKNIYKGLPYAGSIGKTELGPYWSKIFEIGEKGHVAGHDICVRKAINNLFSDKINLEGVETNFCLHFISKDMESDLDQIETYLVTHCRNDLGNFVDHTSNRIDNLLAISSPKDARKVLLTSALLIGAKKKNPDCIGLLKYLFKTYYHSLHNQLKRFTSLTLKDIATFVDNIPSKENSTSVASIIIVMCTIHGIPLANNCTAVCSIITQYTDQVLTDLSAKKERQSKFTPELLSACRKQAREWIKANPQIETQWKTDERFIRECFKRAKYPKNYDYVCRNTKTSISDELTYTLATLKSIYPDNEFSFEEVKRQAHVRSLVLAITTLTEEKNHEQKLIYELNPVDSCSRENTRFHPEDIVTDDKPVLPDTTIKLADPPPAENDAKSDACDCIKDEMDTLKDKLSHRESEYQNLKEQYSLVLEAKKDLEQMLTKFENDREELIALRQFVYNLERTAPEDTSISMADKEKEIAERKFSIIGGHTSWHRKLKAKFPKWSFIALTDYMTITPGFLENKDKIFFFTDYINHITYNKCIAIIRNRKIPFFYLHAVNMEQVITQIYENRDDKQKRT